MTYSSCCGYGNCGSSQNYSANETAGRGRYASSIIDKLREDYDSRMKSDISLYNM